MTWRKSLEQMRAMEADWDGYGAAKPDGDVIRKVEKFLEANPKMAPFRMAPSPDGSIILAWGKDYLYLEAEFNDSDNIEWMMAENSLMGREFLHWETPCTK